MPPSSDGAKEVDMHDTLSFSAQLTRYVESQRRAEPLKVLDPWILGKPVMQSPVDGCVDDSIDHLQNAIIMDIEAKRRQERKRFGEMDACEEDVDVEDLTPECPGLTATQKESLQKYEEVRVELARACCDATSMESADVQYVVPKCSELWYDFLDKLGPANFYEEEMCTPLESSGDAKKVPRRQHWTSVKTSPLPASNDDAVSGGILSREEITRQLRFIDISKFLAEIKKDMSCLLCNEQCKFNDQVDTMLEFNEQAEENLINLSDFGKEISTFLSTVIESADKYLGPVFEYPGKEVHLNTLISQMQDMVTKYDNKTSGEKRKILADLAHDLNKIKAGKQKITCDDLIRLFTLPFYALRVFDDTLIGQYEFHMHDFELQQLRIEGKKHCALHDPSSAPEFELPALKSTFAEAWVLVNRRMIKVTHSLQELDYEDWSQDGIECMQIFFEDLMQLLYNDEMEYLKMFLNHSTLSVANTSRRMSVFNTAKDTAHVLMSIFSTEETASQKLDALRQGLLTQQQFAERIQQVTKESFVRETDDAWHELIRILMRNLEIVESALPEPLIKECLTGLKIAQDRAQADREVQPTQEAVMLPAPAAPWTSNEGTSARGETFGRGRGRKPRNDKRSSQRQPTTASRTPTARGAPSTLDEGTSARGKSSGCGQKHKAMSSESSATTHVEMSTEQNQHYRTRSGRRVKRPRR